MKCTIYKQRDAKGRKYEHPPIIGDDVSILPHDSKAVAELNGRCGEVLCHCRILWVSSNGIMLSGLEERYYGDRQAFVYQEWWCCTETEKRS